MKNALPKNALLLAALFSLFPFGQVHAQTLAAPPAAAAPDPARLKFQAGVAAFGAKQYARAEADFEEAIRLRPGDADAHNALGIVYDVQGRSAESLAEFRETVRLRPHFFTALYRLGRLLEKQNDRVGAIAAYREAIRARSDFVPAHYTLANALDDSGQHEAAIAEYRETLRLAPRNADAHNALGNVLDIQGHHAEAATEYRAALAAKPDFALAHYNLGLALDAQGQTPGAVAEYRAALKLSPGLAVAKTYLAKALAKQGKPTEGSKAAREARAERQASEISQSRLVSVAASPVTLDTRLARGTALYNQGNVPAAIVLLKQAVAAAPRNAVAHYRLALALDDSGQGQAALRHYQTALHLNPAYAAALNSLGTSLYLAGSRAGARRAWRKARTLGNPQEAQNAEGLLNAYP